MGRTLTCNATCDGPPLGETSARRFERIVLVGFMGSGKTSVGRILAERVGWRFVDIDEAIEHEQRREIPQIFAQEGEDGFRRIEHSVAERLIGENRIVIATGGGWPCREGRLDSVGEDTLSLWLRVSPERALERIRQQGTKRPLLEVPEPLTRARELLAAREVYYQKADWWVDSESNTPEDVARRVMDRLWTEPERPLRD